MAKRIIIFAPHPDDETVGCGGIIAKRLSEGYDVIIVVMTDGRYAFSKILGITRDPSPEELKIIRKQELIEAAKVLGVTKDKIIFLDYEDCHLKDNFDQAENQVTGILKENLPTEVYFPFERDHHIDHRTTNQIVRSSIQQLGLPTVKYRYSVAQRHSRFHLILDAVINFFKHNKVSVDVSHFLLTKEKALQAFKSEVSIISSKQQRTIVSNSTRHLKNKETFYIDT